VPPNDPKGEAGYTWDPYRDACQLVDIHSPQIPFHNYRQIHIGEVAFFKGQTAPSIDKIPQCPPLWQDCEHYWAMSSLAGYYAGHPDERPTLAPLTGFLKNEFTVGGKVDWKSTILKVLVGLAGIAASPEIVKLLPVILKAAGVS
jgi:hypothetical protein